MDLSYVVILRKELFQKGDEIHIGSKQHEIIAVESLDKIEEGIAHIGLVIPVTDEDGIKRIESLNLKGQLIEVTKRATKAK